MPAKKHHVRLCESELEALQRLTTTGKASARKINRARILLLSNEADDNSSKTDEEIATVLGVSTSTVVRVRQRFVKEGFEDSLHEKPRPGQRPKLTGKGEARLIALACSEAPEGRARWTLRLLAHKLVELKVVDSISHKTVGCVLKKTNLSPGRRSNGVSAN